MYQNIWFAPCVVSDTCSTINYLRFRQLNHVLCKMLINLILLENILLVLRTYITMNEESTSAWWSLSHLSATATQRLWQSFVFILFYYQPILQQGQATLTVWAVQINEILIPTASAYKRLCWNSRNAVWELR